MDKFPQGEETLQNHSKLCSGQILVPEDQKVPQREEKDQVSDMCPGVLTCHLITATSSL